MQKLQAIQDALVAAKVARPEQIHALFDGSTPRQSGSNTATGVQIADFTYQGHIRIRKFESDERRLIAVAMAWLIDNGGQYDTFDSLDGEAGDDNMFTVNLHFTLVEPIHLVLQAPDYAGADKVTLGGNVYIVADDTVNKATQLDGVTVTLET